MGCQSTWRRSNSNISAYIARMSPMDGMGHLASSCLVLPRIPVRRAWTWGRVFVPALKIILLLKKKLAWWLIEKIILQMASNWRCWKGHSRPFCTIALSTAKSAGRTFSVQKILNCTWGHMYDSNGFSARSVERTLSRATAYRNTYTHTHRRETKSLWNLL